MPNWEPTVSQGNYINIQTVDQVPIAFFTGTDDLVCPRATALEYAGYMFDSVEDIYTYHVDHHFWTYASDEDFMTKLVQELQIPTQEAHEFLS